jgi:hypothetical protein
VGNDPGHAGGGSAGSAAGAGHSSDGGSAIDQALRVHVEDVSEMTIEVITLACAGDCAEVEAVASSITHESWSTYCATLMPTHAAASLTLVPNGGGGANVGAVLVDDLVVTASCP